MTNDTVASGRDTVPAVDPEPTGESRAGTAAARDAAPEAPAPEAPAPGPAGTPAQPDTTDPGNPPGRTHAPARHDTTYASYSPSRAALGILAGLSLAWLAVMLWVAHASVSSDAGAVALATAASSLPSLVSAALVGGAATGLLASGLPGAPAGSGRSAGARFGTTVGAGAVIGLAAGIAFIAVSGTDPARMVLAGTLAAGATLGGAIAGLRATRVVLAAVAAALAVFITGFALGLVKAPIQDLYGAGGGEAARLSAAGWFAATSATACGLAAGFTAYRVLGGARRRPALRWPAYLVAGAGPGVLLLVTEVIVRTGGAKLLGLVREISDADRVLQTWAGGSRVNNALVVLFVGAIVAIIGLGRTLGTPASDQEAAPAPGNPAA